MTYSERLRQLEAARAAAPKREYLCKAEYTKLKAALTRARNSGDPMKVLKAVEKAVARFDATTWPDDWSLWKRALEDAAWDPERGDGYESDEVARELHAASVILFR